MKKKLVILGFLIMIAIVGAFIYESHSSQRVKVGDTYFSIPNEYKIENVSKNLVRFVGNNEIYYINGDVNSSDINKLVSDYVNFKNRSENLSVKVSQINQEGVNFYKAVVINNSSVVHYWFIKENKTYEIYTPTANSNTDNLILNVVKPMKLI